jgi:DNA-binding CsgD family transcriptional regulator
MVADGAIIDGQRLLLRSTFSSDIDDAVAGTEHHYQHINPRVLAIPKMRAGRSTRDQDFISWDAIHMDQTYQELIIPAGLGHFSGVPMINSRYLVAGIALHRPIADAPFSDLEAAKHEYVSRMCAGVFELVDRITNRHAKNVLDMLGTDRAAAVFDRAGRLIEYNDAYDALCQRRSAFVRVGRPPDLVATSVVPAWRQVVRRQQGTIQISGLDRRDPFLFCTILPMPLVGQYLYSAGNVLALFREELIPTEIDQGGLQADFCLTSAETETVVLISCGCSVHEVSQRRSVAIETTRSLLKRALSKVGKRSQPELVALVHGYRNV